ncbi:MAG TPA: peptidylprolyl isomerase [Gemmatimonadales bacterium]|nr:peptidylprolyl isomerase [Gemmatimonadales bacterium]
MRRLSFVLFALVSPVVIGCNALHDAFSSRADVAASANGQTLTVNRLAEWAGSTKQVPLDPLTLSRVSRYWVEYALLADALASGKDLRDSATAAVAMWPLVSRLKWQHFHEKLAATHTLTAQQVDSAYQAGQVRIFQHILFQVPQTGAQQDSAARRTAAQKQQQAEQILSQARSAGPRFAQLASRYSDDPGSKVAGGSLGVSTRGQFVPQFEAAAWQLAPGGVSPVVKTQFGYHIIRRPPLAEVRDSFRVGLQQHMAHQEDSLHVDSLNAQRKIHVVKRAPSYAKQAVQDIDAARTSGRVLVEYRGGAMTVADFVRWLGALDPQILQALPQANDDQINQFLKSLAQQQLMLQQAESAKVALTPEDWQRVRAEHDSTMTTIESLLHLTPEVLRDSAGQSSEQRRNFAGRRVDDYFERVFKGRARFFPLPAFLADTLLATARWDVDEAGIRRAVERAQELRADTTQSDTPRMTPAPGPPPVDTSRHQGTAAQAQPR